MKQKLNFATWWRYFSGQSKKIEFSTTFRPLIWRHQVAILNLCFIEANLNFLLYHMQKTFFAYLYPKKSCKIFELTYKKTTIQIQVCNITWNQ